MTGSKTATVETLTAEVRVLMVGSRQVTLSVYGQLDWVRYDQIEPFGRVRPKDALWGRVYVVGRAADGSLVRSQLFAPWRWISDNGPKIKRRDPRADDAALWRDIGADYDGDTPRQVAGEWEALPLIVLAGLR